MSLKKLLPIIVILGLVLAAPLTAQACPDKNKSDLMISVKVTDLKGDGVGDDAAVSGILTLVSRQQSSASVTVTYYLTYVPTGVYNGPYEYGKNWTFSKTYAVSSSSAGVDNQISYSISSLPYPGYYKLRAVAVYNGQHLASSWVRFDPPGGSPGPIGC